MLLSNLIVRHKTPQPRFAPGLFLLLLTVFVFMGPSHAVVALAGIGTTLIVMSVLVEANRERIWADYRKSYKRQKGLKSIWTEPNPRYYTINVKILWPFIFVLGVVSLWAAYSVGV